MKWLLLAFALLSGCKGTAEVCTPGADSCRCGPLDACDEGLVCASQRCTPALERSVLIDAPGARACEFVLLDGSEAVRGVRFASAVQGARRQRGPRNAVALISSSDVELSGEHVVVQSVAALGVEPGTAIGVESVSCFDRLGRPIEGAAVRVPY